MIFISEIPGSNCCEWYCSVCATIIVSPSKPICSHCHPMNPNPKSELDMRITPIFANGMQYAYEKDIAEQNEHGQRFVKYHCPECKTVYGYDRPCTCVICGFTEDIGVGPSVKHMIPGLPSNPGVPTVPGT